MRKNILWLCCISFIILGAVFPKKSLAFLCSTGIAYIDKSLFESNPSATEFDFTAKMKCMGNPLASHFNDRMYYGGITWNTTALNTYGFTGSVTSASYCQWPSSQACGLGWPDVVLYEDIRGVTIKLKRPAGAVSMPANTLFATVTLNFYSNTGSKQYTLQIRLKEAVNIVKKTCDVDDFDKTVILPSVSKDELTAYGTFRRYAHKSKDFQMKLKCQGNPKVNVTFTGTSMPGVTDDGVLQNEISGNTDVGIQLVYDNSPVELGTTFTTLTSAGENEILPFTAYYYYKNGSVFPGAIKSHAEFLFSYE